MMILEKKGIPKVRDPWTRRSEYVMFFNQKLFEYSENSLTLFDSYGRKKSLIGFLAFFRMMIPVRGTLLKN